MKEPTCRKPITAVCMSDPAAAARVQAAVDASHTTACHVSPVQLTRLVGRPAPYAALIYDLAPWDDSISTLLHMIRRGHPALPILLYPPQRGDVSAILLRCGTIAGLRVRLQRHDSQESRSLREHVRWLLAAIHAERVIHLVGLLRPELPSPAQEYVRHILARLTGARGGRPLTVGSLVADLEVPQRTLQRAVNDGGLPSPKALLDWITLMFATLSADATSRSTASVARDFGVDAHRIYRIRRRLLGSAAHQIAAGPAQEFDLAFLAFADACRVSRGAASALLDRTA